MLTGTLPTLSREDAKQLIEQAGGKVVQRGEQENQLRRGRRGCRNQTGEGPGTRRPRPDRRRTARPDHVPISRISGTSQTRTPLGGSAIARAMVAIICSTLTSPSRRADSRVPGSASSSQ